MYLNYAILWDRHFNDPIGHLCVSAYRGLVFQVLPVIYMPRDPSQLRSCIEITAWLFEKNRLRVSRLVKSLEES